MTYPFTLPDLPYAHNALAPVLTEETMQYHHDKHHAAYVAKLNDALKDLPEFQKLSLQDLLARLDDIPEASRTAVKNNGGGHANHTMFWDIMGPAKGTGPVGDVAKAIDATYGSFDEFKKQFQSAGEKQFGSGWVFVTVEADGKLGMKALSNQETPLNQGQSPLFCNDVWEHAYYIDFRNRRPDYLRDWWQVVNWDRIEERYQAIRGGTRII